MQTLTGHELDQLCNTTSLLVTVGDMYICEQDWLSQSNKINKELVNANSLEEIKAVLTIAIGKNFRIDEDKLTYNDKYIEVRAKVIALVGEINCTSLFRV